MLPTIALAIPHCPWDPHRAQHLKQLKEALEIRNDRDECERTKELAIFAEVGPQPNWVWSAKMFEWMAKQETDYVMQIQDDVLVCPRFWDVVYAALEGLGPAAEVLSLFTLAPQAASIAKEQGNWVSTTDWMTGPTWIVKTSFMRDFVHFRNNRLRKGWIEAIAINSLNEDTLLGFGAAALGKRIYTPIPALVDHNVSLASQNAPGRPANRFDKAGFAWKDWSKQQKGDINDLALSDFWIPRNPGAGSKDRVLHMGVAYSFTYHNFLRWVKDDGEPFGNLPWDKRADQLKTDIVQLEVR